MLMLLRFMSVPLVFILRFMHVSLIILILTLVFNIQYHSLCITISLSVDYSVIIHTVFPRNLAMARFYFKALFGAATIRGRQDFEVRQDFEEIQYLYSKYE